MAANLKQKRKKLYFDLGFNKATTNVVVPCTQYTSGTVQGDRYGGLLDAYQAMTGSSMSEQKAKNAVSAWFQPNSYQSTGTTVAAAAQFDVFFVGPTAAAVGVGAQPRLKYLTVGGAAINAFSGHEAIYGTAGTVRHFAVRVHKRGASYSVAGTLYVQRQHSIEV